MSNLAENLTMASTWQLKHQIAYWKARAIALQYENSMLQEVIRRNLLVGTLDGNVNEVESDTEAEQSDCHSEYSQYSEESDFEMNDSKVLYCRNKVTKESDCQKEENSSESESDENEDDLVVSEEFIQFLIGNAKYREDAKRERERLKAKLEEESKPGVQEQESIEAKILRKKELYGDSYKKVMALEMYLKSEFQNGLDKTKATYWPIIPFNFNFNN